MSVKPITPAEVPDAKAATFPDEVLQAFNELIAENYRDGQSVVLQDAVVDRIVAKLNANLGVKPHQRQEVFTRGWLDVEEVYRKAGWIVEYDKLAYNEEYLASFTFTRRWK